MTDKYLCPARGRSRGPAQGSGCRSKSSPHAATGAQGEQQMPRSEGVSESEQQFPNKTIVHAMSGKVHRSREHVGIVACDVCLIM